jgi:hypothetical protein
MTDTRLIINGLDAAGDVLAEMAKREGSFNVHVRADEFGVHFEVGKFVGDGTAHYTVGEASGVLPGAFLKMFEAVSAKQEKLDAEARDRAEFEAFRAQKREAA